MRSATVHDWNVPQLNNLSFAALLCSITIGKINKNVVMCYFGCTFVDNLEFRNALKHYLNDDAVNIQSNHAAHVPQMSC